MDLDGLILEIHRAAHDPLRWESVLWDLLDLFDAKVAAMTDRQGAGYMVGVTDVDQYAHLWQPCLCDLLDRYRQLELLPIGIPITGGNLMVGRQAAMETRFYREWMAPQGLHHILLARITESYTLRIFGSGGRGPFDDWDRAACARLLEHVTYATQPVNGGLRGTLTIQ